MAMMNKAIFLDKDGTLINDVPYNVDPQRVTLTDEAAQGLRIFQELGYRLIVVSNQPGVAKGYFSQEALQQVERRIVELLQAESVSLHGFYYCPHHPHGSVARYATVCGCRKPFPGLLLRAASEHNIDLSASWMIGDILHDMEAGKRAGCRTIMVDNGNETEWKISRQRMPDFIATNLHSAALVIAQQEMPSMLPRMLESCSV